MGEPIIQLFRLIRQYEEWSLIATVVKVNHSMSCEICRTLIQSESLIVIGTKYDSLFTNHYDCYQIEADKQRTENG